MVVDAVRTYLDAANGLTELSRKDAVAAAKSLLRANGQAVNTAPAQPSATGEGEARSATVGQSIQNLAGELIETSQSNRAAIADLVRTEVARQLESADAVPRAEYERVVRRVAELERRLAARHAVERALAAEAGIVLEPSVRTQQQDEQADDSAETAAPTATAVPTAEEGTAEDTAVGGTAETEQTAADEPAEDTTADESSGPTGSDTGPKAAAKAAGTKKSSSSDGNAGGKAKAAATKPKSRSTSSKRTTKSKGAAGPSKK